VSQKKQAKLFLLQYVKLPSNLTLFGTKMANSLKLYEVHLFSTSTNSLQCTTVLNEDIACLFETRCRLHCLRVCCNCIKTLSLTDVCLNIYCLMILPFILR